MKLNIQRKDNALFAADLSQLKAFSGKLSKQTLVLAGELFLCSLETIPAQPGFVPQSSRRATAVKLGAGGASAELKLSLNKDTLPEVSRLKIKPVFAVDCLLKYGLKLSAREEHVVMAAFGTSFNTSVTAMVFKKGSLVLFQEFEASHPQAHTHDSDLHALLERMKSSYPGAQIHWCGPLIAPKSFETQVAPEGVWSLGTPQALTNSGKASFSSRHGLPLLIILLAAAGYSGAVFVPYKQYQGSLQSLASESSSLQGQYAFASERLALLGAQQAFFGKQAELAPKLLKIERVLAALSEGGVKTTVKEALVTVMPPTAPQGSTPVVTHDFELTIEVERDPDINAIAQSEPILKSLSEKLGASLRLATENGHRENVPTGEKGTRTYRIQGDFNRAS